MRPRSELRQAVVAIFPEQGGATWRDAAQQLHLRGVINVAARGEIRLVKKAVENSVQAGDLQRVPGVVRVPGARRPMARYARRSNWIAATTAQLDCVMQSWRA